MKSSILKTLENCAGSISSTLRTKNSKKPSRTRVRSWKHQWLLLCLARSARTIRIVGMVIIQIRSNQNSRVFWKPVNPPGKPDGESREEPEKHKRRNSTLVRHRPFQGESNIDFLGESEEGSLPQPQDSFPDAGEAINDFWSMSGNFIYRHHVEPRVKLYSPREESFPVPVKYIDVSRTTHTNLDVMQERRIDDYWNIDGSDYRTGFTQFTQNEEKPPDGYMWSGGRMTTAVNIQARLFMARALDEIGKERHKNGHMKNQNSIMPEDYAEFISLTLRTRSSKKPLAMLEKLEIPTAPAMPCKTCKKRVKLYEPRETTFPIPSKCIDVSRTPNTSWYVMLEKNINDYWNVDGDRELSDTWTGFTIFTKLIEKPPDGYTRPPGQTLCDYLWQEIWKEMSDASKRKKKGKVGCRETKARQCQEIAWYLLH